jgi:hypothetical protein
MSPPQAFVVIGAQKSATTTLSEMLGVHPDVYAPRGEVGCFDDPYDEERAAAMLSQVIAGRGAARSYGFKRADLLQHREGAARIARHLPNAKLFAVLREPIARTISAYFHYLRAGLLPLVSVETALRGILDGSPEWNATLGPQIIDDSHYAPQLSRYRTTFGDQLLVFTQDDLRADLYGALKSCFAALDVDANAPLAAHPTAKNLGVYSMGRLRWLRVGSKLVYRYRPGDEHFTTHASLPRMGVMYATAAVDRALFRGRRGDVPELSASLRARLGELFLPDIEAAEAAVGHPLPNWREAARLT